MSSALLCGTFACWKLGASLMLRFISAVKVFTLLQLDLQIICLKLWLLKISLEKKKNRRKKRFNCPLAIGVSIVPCYEQGGFYQQQIQAVGFYGGSEARAASVMRRPLRFPARLTRGSTGD